MNSGSCPARGRLVNQSGIGKAMTSDEIRLRARRAPLTGPLSIQVLRMIKRRPHCRGSPGKPTSRAGTPRSIVYQGVLSAQLLPKGGHEPGRRLPSPASLPGCDQTLAAASCDPTCLQEHTRVAT